MTPTYLCGPINGRSDADCKGWRETAMQWLGIGNYLDPMARDYRGVEHSAFREIVEQDKKDIDRCNSLLVMFDKPSVGTSMEVLYAWERGKHVVLVDVSGKPLSPWMRYHASIIFADLAPALQHIQPKSAWGF